MSKTKYTVETIPVGDLIVDRRVQRTGFEFHKIEKMKANWNDDALGVITVSRRKDRSQVILDGAHRHRVYAELTDNQGELVCHVFEGLSLAEEAEIFLALNNTTQPVLIDKFRVRIVRGDPDAVAIDEIVRGYSWVISRQPANHNVAAVGTLEKLYRLSEKLELEPNLVQSTMLVVTRAWGGERAGAGAVILEGIGRVIAENRAKIVLEDLINKLKAYQGGPATLHAEATQMAVLRRGRVAMAVAELVVEAYNKGRRSTGDHALPRWTRRS
jgi:hypothetical protein